MKTYGIIIRGDSMVIIDHADGRERAEYLLTPGRERAEVAAMRRTIEKHLNSGGTLGNYQW